MSDKREEKEKIWKGLGMSGDVVFHPALIGGLPISKDQFIEGIKSLDDDVIITVQSETQFDVRTSLRFIVDISYP